MAKILIGPVTRENTPMAVEVSLANKVISDAKIMGRHMRGFEYMLAGLVPSDAPYFTERICGICSTAHTYASCLALEDATTHDLTKNGVLIRNIIFLGDLLQNHLRHFYLLSVPDYVHLAEEPPWLPRYTFRDRLPSAVTKRITANYFKAFEVSRDAHTLSANFGGRTPHTWSIQPGGATVQPTGEKIMRALANLRLVKEFVTGAYREDLLALVEAYPEYSEYGSRPHNYISFGLVRDPDKPSEPFLPGGAVLEGQKEAVEVTAISESIEHSWYSAAKEVEEGPFYHRSPEPDRQKPGAYSFIKAVRYKGKACEGGPIARAVLHGGYQGGNAVWDRHLARQWEAERAVELMERWINQLQENQPSYVQWESPEAGKGQGLFDAMRGPLGHWVEIAGGKIKNYTVVTPSVWNMGTRVGAENLSPLEEALIGTPIEDVENPVEIGRVVRSFDPCTACAVHVITPTRKLEPFRIV